MPSEVKLASITQEKRSTRSFTGSRAWPSAKETPTPPGSSCNSLSWKTETMALKLRAMTKAAVARTKPSSTYSVAFLSTRLKTDFSKSRFLEVGIKISVKTTRIIMVQTALFVMRYHFRPPTQPWGLKFRVPFSITQIFDKQKPLQAESRTAVHNPQKMIAWQRLACGNDINRSSVPRFEINPEYNRASSSRRTARCGSFRRSGRS